MTECPKCNAPMILVTDKDKGEGTSSHPPYWRCPNWPKCKTWVYAESEEQ